MGHLIKELENREAFSALFKDEPRLLMVWILELSFSVNTGFVFKQEEHHCVGFIVCRVYVLNSP